MHLFWWLDTHDLLKCKNDIHPSIDSVVSLLLFRWISLGLIQLLLGKEFCCKPKKQECYNSQKTQTQNLEFLRLNYKSIK